MYGGPEVQLRFHSSCFVHHDFCFAFFIRHLLCLTFFVSCIFLLHVFVSRVFCSSHFPFADFVLFLYVTFSLHCVLCFIFFVPHVFHASHFLLFTFFGLSCFTFFYVLSLSSHVNFYDFYPRFQFIYIVYLGLVCRLCQ